MYKQITMLITLGLVLTLGVLTTIYTQQVYAADIEHIGPGLGPGQTAGTAGGSPGQNAQDENGNSQGGTVTPGDIALSNYRGHIFPGQGVCNGPTSNCS